MANQTNLSNEEILKIMNDGKKMLFFTADWCPDCNAIKPVMPAIMDKFNQYDWITVDRDANLEIAQKFEILGIPTFIALDNGKELGRLGTGQRLAPKEVEDFIAGL